MGDPIISKLLLNDYSNYWGIVCVCCWNPCFKNEELSFNDEYNKFISFLRNTHNNIDDYLYIYPYNAMHVTIQTLIPFTQTEIQNKEEKQNFIKVWIKEIKKQFNEHNNDIKQTLLNIKNIEIRESAGIILFSPNNIIERMRDYIDNSKQELLKYEYLGFNKDLLSLNNRPSIIHSTFIRRKQQVNKNLIKSLNHSIQQYKKETNSPLFTEAIKVTNINICEEIVPYMHRIENNSIKSPTPLEIIEFE